MLFAAVACATLLPAATAAVPANGRAWELVTPGEVAPSRIGIAAPAAPNAASMAYLSFGPMAGGPSGALLNLSRAVRGASGWTSSPLTFPYTLPDSPEAFEILLPFVPAGEEDDPYSLVVSAIPLSSDFHPSGYDALYRRLPSNGFSLVAILGEDVETLFYFRYYGGFVEPIAESDAVVFASTEHLRPSDAGRTEGSSIYESAGSTLRQVDVGDDGTSISPCGSIVSHHNGISSSGSRVFFTSPPSTSSCAGPSEVYLREGGATTTKISASRCTRADCGPGEDVAFVGATPDGRFAFLDTTQQLTSDDEDSLRDLYRYDVSDGGLTLISGGDATATGALDGWMVFPSDDGAYVYFYSDGQLVPGDDAPTHGESLYMLGPDGLRYVAPAEHTFFNTPPIEESVQLARGGEVALFNGAAAGADGDIDRKIDVYLYDAGGDTLTRLSDGSTGGNGEFDATMTTVFEQELVPGKPFSYSALSEDGHDAFFSTAEALVPEDFNTSADIYEWRQGHLGLVSSGVGSADDEVLFVGSSPDGGTAFFQTNETLVPRDLDGGEADVYAARVGGGFAEGALPSSRCETPACLPGPAARLSRRVPASARGDGKGGSIRLLKVLHRGGDGDRAATQLELLVSVPARGRVSVIGTESGGSRERIVEGEIRVGKPGRARILLRLSGPLRRKLAQGSSVRVRLTIREAKWQLIRTVTLVGGPR